MSDFMTRDEIQRFIDTNRWIYAKTMPRFPHEYCLKKECPDPVAFERFVLHIRKYGYEGRFFRTPRIYFRFGPHKYWTMGAPLEETILINRALVRPYDYVGCHRR